MELDQQLKEQILNEINFKEYAKMIPNCMVNDQKPCQIKHDLQQNLSESHQKQRLLSKFDQIYNIKLKQIKPILSKEKKVINKKVLNDYIEVVNKRGEIVDHVCNEYNKLVEAKTEQLQYFRNYYNDSTLKELENTIQSLGPKFRYGINTFMKSAQGIKDKVTIASQQMVVREQKLKEKQIEEEKQRKLKIEQNKNKNDDWWENIINEKKDPVITKQQAQSKSKKERIAKMTGYLIDSQDVSTAKQDIQYLLEMQKFGSARMKQIMFESDMKIQLNSIKKNPEKKENLSEQKSLKNFINRIRMSIKMVQNMKDKKQNPNKIEYIQKIPELNEDDGLNLSLNLDSSPQQRKKNQNRNSLTSRINSPENINLYEMNNQIEPYQLSNQNQRPIIKQNNHYKSLSSDLPQTEEGVKTTAYTAQQTQFNTENYSETSHQIDKQIHNLSINLQNASKIQHQYENKPQTSREFKTVQFQKNSDYTMTDQLGNNKKNKTYQSLSNSLDEKDQKELEEYQKKQADIYLQKINNTQHINKFQEKVLGKQKNNKPKFSQEQLKQYEHKTMEKYKGIKHNIQQNYQFQRKKINDELKMQELYGDKINKMFKQILTKQNFKKLFHKLSSQSKNLDTNFKAFNSIYDNYLGENKLIFWNMSQKRFEKLKQQELIQRQNYKQEEQQKLQKKLSIRVNDSQQIENNQQSARLTPFRLSVNIQQDDDYQLNQQDVFLQPNNNSQNNLMQNQHSKNSIRLSQQFRSGRDQC